MRGAGVRRRAFAALALAASAACASATGPEGPVADLRGTWQYSGSQSAPAVTLTGTLRIQAQRGDEVSGELTWQEQLVGGGIQALGGPVAGRVISTTDVDFDVLLSGTERRHVGRIVADTIRGAWIEVGTGRSGEFTAIRSAAP